MAESTSIARSSLLDSQIRAGARVELQDGWQVAVRFPREPAIGGNALVDLSHRGTFEINGPATASAIQSLCSSDLALRKIHRGSGFEAYRLTPTRSIVFGRNPGGEAIDVTGGWASLALVGPNARDILQKITAVDVRDVTFPILGCCQGPIFGVNTLFGHFEKHYELHVCSDSIEFLQEVLLDGGGEFGLQMAGSQFLGDALK